MPRRGDTVPNTSDATRTISAGRTKRAPLARPAPLRHAVYDALVEMVITGELQPGQHLVETDLGAQLGVSRQPIREALLRMNNEGWVDVRPSLGAFVHMPTDAEADELLSVRTLLEGESASLAAGRVRPDQIERLRELQRDGEEALAAQDQEAMVAANSALHAYIASISGNNVLSDLIASVDRRVRWYYTAIAGTRGKDSWDEHAEIVDAICRRNSRRAGDLMRRHADRTREAYRTYAIRGNSKNDATP